MPLVKLNGTYGYGRPRRYYGPGLVDVPEGLARALGLTPLPEVTEAEPAATPQSDVPEVPEIGDDAPPVKRTRKSRASE